MTWRYRFANTLVILCGLLAWATGLAQTADRDRLPTRELLDAINNRPTVREHHTWGIFLGFGATQKDLEYLQRLQQAQKLINPLTGQPFQDVKIFVFGYNNRLLEGFRVLSDHLEIHMLSSWKELDGQHFDYGICHSNGCTNALDAQRQGVMRVEHFYALGTDWTSKSLRPGALRGADMVMFAAASDPVWKLPAPNLVLRKDHIGWEFVIPFDSPRDILRGGRNLLTRGQADTDRFPVVLLEPPMKPDGTRRRFFQAHSLLESYFPAIERWMHTDGPLQKTLKERLSPQKVAPVRDDETKGVLPPGGGGGGGPGGAGGNLSRPGGGLSPSTPGLAPRGGIAIPITIAPEDIQRQ